MKRSVNILFSLMLGLLVTAGMSLHAQDESVSESKTVSISSSSDGKVTLKVTTKIGNDTKKFEKTYDSHEEMYEDPELEKYGISADDVGFGAKSFGFGSPNHNFSFKKGPSGSKGHNFSFFHDDDDGDAVSRSFSFGFDLDSMMNHMGKFQSGGPLSFHFGPGKMMDMDSLMGSFGFNGHSFSFGDDDEEGHRIHSFSFGNGNDEDNDNHRVISRVKVFVRSAREADKKKVGADEMEDLQIQDISFYPNPSDGRFALELETGNENPVQIKIVGPDGSVVYERTGQSTDGFYDYQIDISGQREGIYIMQVIQNNRSLTKRIIIE